MSLNLVSAASRCPFIWRRLVRRGLIRLLLAGGLAFWRLPADFLIALYPLLTEAWARHDFDVLHAFVFLAIIAAGVTWKVLI